MSDFQITLKVNGNRLATVLEALKGAAELVSVLPCEEPARLLPRRDGPYYAGGKRNKGISGQTLALQAFKKANGSITTTQLAKIFGANGFAPASNSPAIAALAQQGLVERVELGRWRLTDKGKEKEL
jgi:hypothetical protein